MIDADDEEARRRIYHRLGEAYPSEAEIHWLAGDVMRPAAWVRGEVPRLWHAKKARMATRIGSPDEQGEGA